MLEGDFPFLADTFHSGLFLSHDNPAVPLARHGSEPDAGMHCDDIGLRI
jgi:hypothetical protein